MNSQKPSHRELRSIVNTTTYTSTQTWIELSRSAFNHNINYYRNLIGADNKLAIVIKANGYGHGLQQIAELCEHNSHINWICVAQLPEALALPTVTKPILVLNYSDVTPEHAVGKNINFMVDNLAYAQKLNAIGLQHSYQFNVHVKVDTGLSRMGVLASEALEFIQELKKLNHIHINGIFSHFAASDKDPVLTQNQFSLFKNLIKTLASNGIVIENVHMGNSVTASTLDYPASFNMFRVGIGAYGLGHAAQDLQPVMTWKTRIAHIKTVPAGSGVSYYPTQPTTRTTRLALLPLGYFDGYDFRFGSTTSVIINGCLAPIMGRVAMNVTIVDVTDIVAQTGDEVILLGGYPGVGVQELAQMVDIKNFREILVGINPAFARIVTQ